MKRFAVALLVVLLACSLCACGIYSQDEVDRIIDREYQRGYDAGQTAGYNSGYSSGYDDGSSVCSNSIDADTYADLKGQSDSLFSAISELEEYVKIFGETSDTRYEQWLKSHPEHKGTETDLSTIWSDIFLGAKDYTSAVEDLYK